MLSPYACGGKDKTLTMVLIRHCRRHIIKIVIAVAVIYLVCAFHFFGTVDDKKVKPGKQTQTSVTQGKRDTQDGLHAGKEVTEDSLYQVIDPTPEHRAKRLEVLKQVYAVPHTPDDVYKLNESLSRTIDLDRPATDLRPDQCKDIVYDLDDLPTVSIIMPIYNEALSMLLRAVHSAINNTPQKLLADIILVDDDSKNENLKEPLERYIALLPQKIRILRNSKREGLIRARMRGAAVAKGQVLMFQDVHTEFSPGWAEAALKYIQQHPNSIVQPVVEELQVNSITWPNKADVNHDEMWRGVFMWDMRYAWNLVPEKYSSWRLTQVDPWPNPVLVGCSLAVGKDLFNKIGGFDQGLNVWGGENIELSLRTWMCGGRMVIHPCSRIAHVFKPFSYAFDGNKEKIIGKNSLRVVETWMDQHRDYYYASNFVYPFKIVELDEQEKKSLKEHKALRQKLECKSFDWYLKNVLPEMNLPSKNMTNFGEVQNQQSKACWLANADGYITSTPDCYTYSRLKHDQEFGITKSGQLVHYGKCVAVTEHFLLKIGICGSSENEKGWRYEVDESMGMQIGVIRFRFPDGAEKCVQQVTNIVEVHKNEQMPQLLDCNSDDLWQKWYITYNLAYHLVPAKPV